ncbi:hypothetical protein MKW98_006075 [Papaver atlanticum]|uniref:NB-ARC domain-containing protein n=1 Tax=Papaver atlanticum TaxID=357466 RepID=A0AAD4XW14_9MAGN|nr:hypothetical protein MKW98_006075 [Papaver atlanticum]
MDAVVSPVVNSTLGLGVKKVKQGIGVRKRIKELGEDLELFIHPRESDAHLSVVSSGYMKEDGFQYLRLVKVILNEFEDLMLVYNNEFRDDPDELKKVDWGKAHLLFRPSSVKRFPLRLRIGSTINSINEKLRKFKEHQNCSTAVPKQTERDCSSSDVNESKILGRDKEKADLMSMLGCSDDTPATTTPTIASTSTSTAVKFVFITGTTGCGKTALAQFVIKDKKVKEHFKHNIFWVSVSGQIDDKKKLAIAIIEAMGGRAPKYHEWEPLHSHLRNCIKEKEVMLLVLDDPCGVDYETWERELKPCFDAAPPGSRIVVTTHLTNLSTMMGVSSELTLPLSGLAYDAAWLLLRDAALPGQSEEQVREYEMIGKELAQRCEGIPSVIKNLGRVLRSKGTPLEWNDVLENGIWNLNEGISNSNNEGLIPRHLFATYDAFLDPALKRCFKFCASLPYEYEIDKGILIKLWMALGHLNGTRTGQMEEKGDMYFNLLTTCSFFHKSNPGGNVYKLYGHVYALARFLAGNESCYYPVIGTSSFSNVYSGHDTRHSTIILGDDDMDCVPVPLSKAVNLQMLKLMTESATLKVPSYTFSQFPYLRALDMSYTGLTKLPSEISKVKLLKILNLSGSRFQKLPDTVCDLKRLESLILNECLELTEFPQKIGQITTLRHLENSDTPKLQKFPKGFGKLINLRTLSKFVVAAQGSRKGAKIGELQELNLLQGCLTIKGLNRVKSGSDAMKAALGDKKDLRSLCLDFERNLSQKPETVQIMEDVLEALRPNAKAISNVDLCNYPSARMPSWWTAPTNQD